MDIFKIFLMILFGGMILIVLQNIRTVLEQILDEIRTAQADKYQDVSASNQPPLLIDTLTPRGRPREPTEF